MPPTVAQVQSALKQVDPASSLRSTALRSLKAWQQHHPEIGVTDEAVNLWLALKGLVGRVTPALMKEMRSSAITSSLLKQKVWVVAKVQMPQVAAEHEPFLIPASSLSGLPQTCNPEEVHFFDQAIPRTSLPKGTMEFELSIGQQTTSAAVSSGSGEVECFHEVGGF